MLKVEGAQIVDAVPLTSVVQRVASTKAGYYRHTAANAYRSILRSLNVYLRLGSDLDGLIGSVWCAASGGVGDGNSIGGGLIGPGRRCSCGGVLYPVVRTPLPLGTAEGLKPDRVALADGGIIACPGLVLRVDEQSQCVHLIIALNSWGG